MNYATFKSYFSFKVSARVRTSMLYDSINPFLWLAKHTVLIYFLMGFMDSVQTADRV